MKIVDSNLQEDDVQQELNREVHVQLALNARLNG